MDEIQHYNALLETYKKQETPLNEKNQQLNEVLAKYQKSVQDLMNIRSQWEMEVFKFNHKKLHSIENLHQILNTCKESDMSWKEIKTRQTAIDDSQKRVNTFSNHHLSIIKGVAEDLKRLDDELKFENVSSKIEEYKTKTQTNQELLFKYVQEFNKISSFNPKLPEYQITGEAYKKRSFPKKIGEINAEMNRINNNLHTIDKKIKELTKSM